MKQIWPDYSYSPATNVLTLTGLNIDRDQLLLVAAPERGRIIYNFADSSVTASAFTSGANTALTLVASTAGLTTTASLVIYYDDQLQSTAVSISNFPATQPVSIASVTVGNSLTIGSLPAISGTVTVGNSVTIGSLPLIGGAVTANNLPLVDDNFSSTTLGAVRSALYIKDTLGGSGFVGIGNDQDEGLPVRVNGTALPISGTVTLGAGTAQIGSVTASISGTVPISISSVTVGNSVTIGFLPAISGTVTANSTAQKYFSISAVTANRSIIGYSSSGGNQFTEWNGAVDAQVVISGSYWANGNPAPVSVANSVTIGSLPLIAGTVTANLNDDSNVIASQVETGIENYAQDLANTPLPISGTVTVGNSVTIASLPAISGTVTASNLIASLGEYEIDAQNKTFSVSAQISGQGYVSDSAKSHITNSVTIASLPAISGTVTANTFALQGTAVTTSDFTSTTASTLLAGFNAGREVLTIFNEGAGNLHICAGATCTTIAYQVRLSAGDYYEVPNHQTTITHSAVFATAGTARVTEVS